ncbi:MAG: TetR/AcrR family transcriptional regulator [Silvanigrellaceae bacterium]|nr:TetR/AcrR family transcriptional regulator [Silvanigrellaceae bacterium]
MQARQTKERVLASAKVLFESNGFDSVTIDELARHAEVSAQTVYSLFQSKRGVLRSLMDEVLPPDQHEALVKQAYLKKNSKKTF